MQRQVIHTKWALAVCLILTRLTAVTALSKIQLSTLSEDAGSLLPPIEMDEVFHSYLPTEHKMGGAPSQSTHKQFTINDLPPTQLMGMPMEAGEAVAGKSLAAWSAAEAELQEAAKRFQHNLLQQHDGHIDANQMIKIADQQHWKEGAPMTERLAQASAHLASQQEFASAQLAQAAQLASNELAPTQLATAMLISGQAGQLPASNLASAHQMVGLVNGGLQQSLLSGDIQAMPMALIQQNQTQNQTHTPLALPQTIAELWHQRNPVVAAMLLQPFLYGYSLLVWILAMLFTGGSSIFCFYNGNKLPGCRRGDSEPSRLSSYFVYPGSAIERPAPVDQPQKSAKQPGEGVEWWIKVPVSVPFSKRGFLDDAPDCANTHVAGSYRPCGYVDDS